MYNNILCTGSAAKKVLSRLTTTTAAIALASAFCFVNIIFVHLKNKKIKNKFIQNILLVFFVINS